MRADLADIAILWPGVEKRDDSLTVVYEAGDIPTAFQFVLATAKVRPGDA